MIKQNNVIPPKNSTRLSFRYRALSPVKWSAIIAITISLIVLVAGTINYTFLSFRSYPQHYNQKIYSGESKYKDTKTITDQQQSEHTTIFVEYPATKSEGANAVIKDYVTALEQQFKDEFGRSIPREKGDESSLHTTYQITYEQNGFISVVMSSVVQSFELAHPEKYIKYWTLDLTTGKIVTLHDLFGATYADASARLMLYIKQYATDILKERGETAEQEILDAAVNTDRITSFLTTSSGSLQFEFEPGVIAATATGQITIIVPSERLPLFLQNDIAKKLFSSVAINQSRTLPSPSQLCVKQKCVALTFDDGPGKDTDRLLEVLKQYNAKATFFLIGGNVAQFPDVVRHIAADDHEIGNHSWNHAYLPKLSNESILQQLSSTNTAIQKASGVEPKLMRPPYGAINDQIDRTIGKAGMPIILWSVDTRDWADHNSDIVAQRITTGVNTGAIVIMHDIHPTTTDAVRKVLPILKREGYSLVTVSDLLGSQLTPGAVYSRR